MIEGYGGHVESDADAEKRDRECRMKLSYIERVALWPIFDRLYHWLDQSRTKYNSCRLAPIFNDEDNWCHQPEHKCRPTPRFPKKQK